MEVLLIGIESKPSLVFPVMQQMLKDAGHECKCIYCSMHRYDGDFLESIANKIAKIGANAGLIGISTTTSSFIACEKLIKLLRDRSNAKIILGGIHPTAKPFESLEVADYVCVGEGEYALLELIDRLDNNVSTDDIQNIYLKKDGQAITNTLRPLVKDLDSLPVPEFDLANTYVYYRGGIHCLADRPDVLHWTFSPFYFIVTSRGCPYTCNYCLNNVLININKDYRIIRRRSNDHIIRELKNFKRVFSKPVTIGFVEDDFCAQSEANLEEFVKLYKKEIGLPFFMASTPSSMTEKKMDLLVDAGLNRLEIGIQSINDKVNKEIYERNSTKKKVVNAINLVSKYKDKIRLTYDIIVDNPWEPDEAKIETLRFLYTIPKPVTISIFSLTLYPGTKLYYRAVEEGLVSNEIDEIYKKNHMEDIDSSSINALIVLCARYGLPLFFIDLMLKLRKLTIFDWFMAKLTLPLWKLKLLLLQMRKFSVLLFNSIKGCDLKGIKYLLALPFYRFMRTRETFIDK